MLLKASFRGGLALGRAGVWLKERRHDGDERTRDLDQRRHAPRPTASCEGIRIFELDTDGRLRTRIEAATGRVGRDSVWQLEARGAHRLAHAPSRPCGAPACASAAPGRLRWPSSLSACRGRGGGAAGERRCRRSSCGATARTWPTTSRPSQRYEIQFWKTRAVPVRLPGDGGAGAAVRLPACARSAASASKVFGGIMLGISFVLLNNVVGPPRHAAQLGAVDRRVRRRVLIYLALSLARVHAGWCASDERQRTQCAACCCSRTARATPRWAAPFEAVARARARAAARRAGDAGLPRADGA